MKDNNGTLIEIGDVVACNRSGDVVQGVVEKFGRILSASWQNTYGTARGNTPLCYTYVRNTRDHELSRVKRPQSMLVIKKGKTK